MTTKIIVWVLTTYVPGKAHEPCLPRVFATGEAALKALKILKANSGERTLTMTDGWGTLKQLPITAAATVAGIYGMRQVIIIALNAHDDTAHVVTYGKSDEDCRLAAEAGNNIKRHMGWPEDSCSSVPERLIQTHERTLSCPTNAGH